MRLLHPFLGVFAAFLVLSAVVFSSKSFAAQSEIQLEIPAIETSQYHRPYIAVWVEDGEQNSVRLIALWVEKPDWLKDLRRFWRKIGRSNQALVDGVTAATQKPGRYSIAWDGKGDSGQLLKAGKYTLYIEAAREQGGRSLVKQDFTWPSSNNTFDIASEGELGEISVVIR